MNEITDQVRRAQRRLNFHRLVHTLLTSLFVTLLVAAIGLAIPKIWPIAFDAYVWMWSWLGGALTAGLVAAVAVTYRQRTTPMDAAIEIDRRFGLKERVSSTLALSPAERETEVGRALVADAVRRAERVDVSEKFTFRRNWWDLLPLLPALIVFVLAIFVPDAAIQKTPQQAQASRLETRKVQRSTQELKKKIAQRRAKAADEQLKEAGQLFDKLEKGVEELQASPLDRKKALVKLNDLADEIKKRRAELGSHVEMQKRLNKMADFKQGPAKQLAKAMKSGQFDKALRELQTLKAKMQAGDMTAGQQKQLANQMQQMADALKSMADSHEAAKEELRRQIEEQQKAGNMANAGELQRKLDKLQKQDSAMNQMQAMAQQLSQSAQSINQGDLQAANEKLNQMAESLEALESQLEEMELLDDALDQIASAKDSMNCDQCNGEGCSSCQGMGNGMGFGDGMGFGQGQSGRGRGAGDRAEAETDSRFYQSRVRGKILKGGKAVVVGTAGGRNVPGQSNEAIKEVLQQAALDEADPLTGQHLPKAQRNHARQYFESLQGK